MGFRSDQLRIYGFQTYGQVGSVNGTFTNKTSFTPTPDYAFPALTPNTPSPLLPATQTYLVHVDVSNFYISTGPFGLDSIQFRLEVNGSVPTQNSANAFVMGLVVNTRVTLAWRTPIALNAGTNTFKLQWIVDDARITANTDSLCSLSITISA